jgi:hypothetical protein
MVVFYASMMRRAEVLRKPQINITQTPLVSASRVP